MSKGVVVMLAGRNDKAEVKQYNETVGQEAAYYVF